MLNLLLMAFVGAAVWQIREGLEKARERERNFMSRPVARPPDPPVAKATPAEPVTAANYMDVAARMLFAKDRNPNVIITPEVKKEDPVPAFPQAFGMLALGEPTVFLAEKAGGPQKGYRAGDAVGAFKLAAITGDGVVLEWKDKSFAKSLKELKPPENQPAAGAGGPQAPGPVTEAPKPLGNPPAEITPPEDLAKAQKATSGDNPWINTGGVNHACAPGDSTPAGTVMNGYRKVVRPSMFGSTCFWEPAR